MWMSDGLYLLFMAVLNVTLPIKSLLKKRYSMRQTCMYIQVNNIPSAMVFHSDTLMAVVVKREPPPMSTSQKDHDEPSRQQEQTVCFFSPFFRVVS